MKNENQNLLDTTRQEKIKSKLIYRSCAQNWFFDTVVAKLNLKKNEIKPKIISNFMKYQAKTNPIHQSICTQKYLIYEYFTQCGSFCVNTLYSDIVTSSYQKKN